MHEILGQWLSCDYLCHWWLYQITVQVLWAFYPLATDKYNSVFESHLCPREQIRCWINRPWTLFHLLLRAAIMGTLTKMWSCLCYANLFLLTITSASSLENMNGEYVISNADPSSAIKWSSLFSNYPDVEYFDVYSHPLSTKWYLLVVCLVFFKIF